MLCVVRERASGIGQIERLRVDDGVRVDSERRQRGHELGVERSHALPLERERPAFTLGRRDHGEVIDEVEVDREDGVRAHRPRRDARSGDMEGHVPPVIASRAVGKPHFPDDLRETVQRLLRRQPLLVGQVDPQAHACSSADVSPRSSRV
jgi:hypothetical protein